MFAKREMLIFTQTCIKMIHFYTEKYYIKINDCDKCTNIYQQSFINTVVLSIMEKISILWEVFKSVVS